MFGFEKKSLVFVRDRTSFTQHPSRRSIHHFDMTEHAVYFWRTGLGAEELLSTIVYSVASQFREEFISDTKVISKIPRLSFLETAFKRGIRPEVTTCAWRMPMFRSAQKPITLMSCLIRKYTQPGAMVPDLCLRGGATAKACLLLAKYRKLMVFAEKF